MIASVWRAFGMVTTTPVTDEELQSFATAVGLNRVAAGRYARLFLSQIYNETVMTSARGEAPKLIAEIKRLAGC
jgi:hypothetical protein